MNGETIFSSVRNLPLPIRCRSNWLHPCRCWPRFSIFQNRYTRTVRDLHPGTNTVTQSYPQVNEELALVRAGGAVEAAAGASNRLFVCTELRRHVAWHLESRKIYSSKRESSFTWNRRRWVVFFKPVDRTQRQTGGTLGRYKKQARTARTTGTKSSKRQIREAAATAPAMAETDTSRAA